MSENTDRNERMTGTPSKDRAEAHMDRAARIIETMAFDVDAVRRNDQERAQRLIASCLATSQGEGFAEGMKRAAEIARDVGEAYGEDETGWAECSETIEASINRKIGER